MSAGDEVCCALPKPLHGVPRGPEREIDVASQSVRTTVLTGHDFSLHVRPGGDADDWEIGGAGESGKVLRAKGEKTVKGTRYFTFRAPKPGTASVVLKETDGDRCTVVGPRPGPPRTTGDPAADRRPPTADRQDWYGFTARESGPTTVELFGCYRCGYDSGPTSAESKKFSVTKRVTVVVR